MRMRKASEVPVEAPPRPYLPPSAFMSLGICVGSALMMQAGWMRHARGDVVPWELAGALIAVGVCVLAGSIACLGYREGFSERAVVLRAGGSHGYVLASAAFLGIGCVLAALSSAWALGEWQEHASLAQSVQVSACTLRVTGDPSLGARGASSTVVLTPQRGDEKSFRLRMTSGEAYEDGDELRVVGRVDPLGDGDWDRSRFMKGEVGSLSVKSVIEHEALPSPSWVGAARAAALDVIDPARDDARALLAGTVCGRVTELANADDYESFSRCGLTHLVAVSGSHLAYIAALFGGCLSHFRLSRIVREGLLLATMGAYVVFTGGAPSAMRSVSMVGMATAAILGGRRAHGPSALFLTVTALVAFEPGVVFDLGFLLSALSVLFITVFVRYVCVLMVRMHVPELIAEPLALTLVAQWATLPLTIPAFGEVSLVAPIANLLVGPLMSALLVVGLAAAVLGTCVQVVMGAFGIPAEALPSLMDAMLWAPCALARASMFFADAFAAIPLASVLVAPAWWLGPALYGAAFVLYCAWDSVSPAVVGACVGIACGLVAVRIVRWALFAPPAVTILNVGQGDAILLRDGSHSVLVDAGVDDATRSALARANVFRLDAVVVTHWDQDHWGGLSEFASVVPVGALVVAEGASLSAPEEVRDTGIPLIEVSCGDVLRVGSFSCRVVWPRVRVAGEENADSLVLDVSYHEEGRTLDMLLTGDTERHELEAYAGEVGDIDVLKLGHHGSRVSVDEGSLSVLEPELAIASAGEGNSYGHPDPACVKLVEQSDARFACTKDAGDIIVMPGRSGVRVAYGGT